MNTSDLDEFVAITNNVVEAILTNDVAKMGEFLSQDWVLVTSEAGPVTRQQFFGAIEGGLLRHETMQIDVLQVKIYGDVALVTGRGRNTGTFKGEPIEADEWTTDVYYKSDGRWQCVLTQLTPSLAHDGNTMPGAVHPRPQASRPPDPTPR